MTLLMCLANCLNINRLVFATFSLRKLDLVLMTPESSEPPLDLCLSSFACSALSEELLLDVFVARASVLDTASGAVADWPQGRHRPAMSTSDLLRPHDAVLVRYRRDPVLWHHRVLLTGPLLEGDTQTSLTPDRRVRPLIVTSAELIDMVMYDGTMPVNIDAADAYRDVDAPGGQFRVGEVEMAVRIANSKAFALEHPEARRRVLKDDSLRWRAGLDPDPDTGVAHDSRTGALFPSPDPAPLAPTPTLPVDDLDGGEGASEVDDEEGRPNSPVAHLADVQPGGVADSPTRVAHTVLAAERARVAELSAELSSVRKRLEDAVSRLGASERQVHSERERANSAVAASEVEKANTTDEIRRRRDAESRLESQLGLPDDRQWRVLLGTDGCVSGSIMPASATRQAVLRGYGFFLFGGEMVLGIRDGEDGTDALLRIGAEWCRRSADLILGPPPTATHSLP